MRGWGGWWGNKMLSWHQNAGKNFHALITTALLSDLNQPLLYCSSRCDILGMAAQRNATFEKGRFPEFATGYYFYATVLLPNFKIYIIFILPLLSIYFYFIAYHVGDIWLLNVWRIGPGCCCCCFLSFLS